MTWRPILEGADADAARAAVAKIADDLASRELEDPCLIRGAAGAALLHGYLAREGRDGEAGRTHRALARALELLPPDRPRPCLATGFVGVAWAMQHLHDVVDADPDTLAAIDDIVAHLLARDRWTFDTSLWEGVVGLGVYALERGARAQVERVVALLDALAEPAAEGVTWWHDEIDDDTRERLRYHNLGYALGTSGILGLYASARANGLEVPMLAPGLAWIASHQGAHAPRFPMCIGMAIRSDRVKNGWCYGDLAMAHLFVRCGAAERGRELARAAALDPTEDGSMVDAALCHGTAGRAHLLNRLGQALGDDDLIEAARRYLRETLARIAHAPPTRVGLTMGSVGIALVLLASTSSIDPAWDRSMLLSTAYCYG